MDCQPSDPPRDFDLDALRHKYAEERDRRLRKEGAGQYRHLEGDLAALWEADPYAPPVSRAAVESDADVVIVGGGFGGLQTAAHLKKQGIHDIRIVDMAGDFGGVWYWNRYPGIQCDNESYTYIPLLEELGWMPPSRFTDGVDIFRHCQNIGQHFGLYEGALFGTRITSARWDAGAGRWLVRTNHGDALRARFVIMAVGPWSKPKLPGIAGLEEFRGHSFHSARWDYAYTGGDQHDPALTRLADKRVAVIGTGATAIQIVPAIARHARHLDVFQRTPSAVDRRRNTPTDPQWAASLQPGWQKRRQANFHTWAWDPFPTEDFTQDATCDFFTEVGRNTAARIAGRDLPLEEMIAIREQEDYAVMERIRRLADEIVTDKATAEALKPYYRYMCKRPCSSNDYLQAFNNPNVTLVDVSGSRGVERITARGVVANGREYPADCLIFASGFEISSQDQRSSYGIDAITGRDGLDLYEYWAEGYQTFHGMSAHGFPGMFFTGFTQVGVSAGVTAMYDQQAEHIAYIVAQALARGAVVEPTWAAQQAWVRTIREEAPPNTFLAECTPGYYNNEGGGKGGIRSAVGEPYAPGFFAFDRLLRDWRAEGSLAGMTLTA